MCKEERVQCPRCKEWEQMGLSSFCPACDQMRLRERKERNKELSGEIGAIYLENINTALNEVKSNANFMLDAYIERIAELELALEEAINLPKGVVPKSAEWFWRWKRRGV